MTVSPEARRAIEQLTPAQRAHLQAVLERALQDGFNNNNKEQNK